MKFLFTLCLGVLLSLSSNAQFFAALTERVEKAKDRILLIEKGDFECNDDIENYFEKHWTFGKGIEIKTVEEINALLTPDDAFKYMVLTGDRKMEAKLNGSSAAEVIGIVLSLGENAMVRNNIHIDRKFVFKVSFPFSVLATIVTVLLT